jgi:hypothetical protein
MKPLNFLVEAEGKKIVKTYHNSYDIIILFDDDTYIQFDSFNYKDNPCGEIMVSLDELPEERMKELGFA